MNLRKILIIIGFIILAIGIGFGIYFIFFKPQAPSAEGPAAEIPSGPAGGLPISGAAAPGAGGAGGEITPGGGGLAPAKTIATADLAIAGAQDITLSADGSAVQYYDSQSGLFYRADSNGVLLPLSDKKFFQVQNATWAADSSKAILEYPDGSNIFYDFTNDKQVTLPKHWEGFGFSPAGDKIVSKSIGDDPNNRWLVISNIDGTNAKVISSLGDNADKVGVAWSPNSQIVAFSATGDATGDFGTQEIYLLGQNNENFKSLKVAGLNFQAAWAKEGGRILYSVADPNNQYKPVLWVADAAGDNIGTNAIKIDLNTNLDKCTIVAGYKAYCAVPAELPEGAGLDMRIVENTDDSFYAINLQTGETNFIGKPETNYDVKQISVSADESYIYFTDAANGGLHQMRIK